MPLDQHIEGGHGERQARLKIRPTPMHHLLQMADERQHREHRLYQHPVLPLAPLTEFQVGGIPSAAWKESMEMLGETKKIQIPPDLVVKTQTIDIVEVI